MKKDYLGRSTGKLPGATEKIGKGNPVFSGRNVPNENSCSISLKLSLIPILDLRGRFLVNGTDLYKMVNAILRQNLPFLSFAYHLPEQ